MSHTRCVLWNGCCVVVCLRCIWVPVCDGVVVACVCMLNVYQLNVVSALLELGEAAALCVCVCVCARYPLRELCSVWGKKVEVFISEFPAPSVVFGT